MAKLNTDRFCKLYKRWEDIYECDLSSPLVKKMWDVFVEDNPNATEYIEEGFTISNLEDILETIDFNDTYKETV